MGTADGVLWQRASQKAGTSSHSIRRSSASRNRERRRLRPAHATKTPLAVLQQGVELSLMHLPLQHAVNEAGPGNTQQPRRQFLLATREVEWINDGHSALSSSGHDDCQICQQCWTHYDQACQHAQH